ncbi:1552_t:CDS:2 [Paraglomus brasilianum]|uniref:1552_t:CDS:1 n=1 Tax=Paraglomus brasilianum TaxID=144538 RepID=A0A9N9FR15_9GLOM|nr:1552_t:CDS:2 [Paraglomus brasilianum]
MSLTKLPPIRFSPEINGYFLKYYTQSKWQIICDALSTAPTMSFMRIVSEPREEVQQVVQSFVDEQCKDKQWPLAMKVTQHSILPDVLCIPVEGPFDIKQYEKEVVVDIFAGTSILRGADIFAFASPFEIQKLTNTSLNLKVEKGEEVAVMVDIDGSCKRGSLKEYKGSKIFIGNGRMEMSRAQIFQSNPLELSGIGVTMTFPLYRTLSLSTNPQLSSLVFLQNLPSILTTHLLSPQPGDLVLDMCASPGGKTTHIAQLLQNNGMVIALDRSVKKVEKLLETVKACGVENVVRCFVLDATKAHLLSTDELARFSVEDIRSGMRTMVKGFPEQTFDRVLLDPPCSGIGQRPIFIPPNQSITYLATVQPDYQKKLFKSAFALLRPGGTLVYSTCTINPLENEHVVGWALREFSDYLILVEPEIKIGEPGLRNAGLNEEERHRVQRFEPGIAGGEETIGFFVAKFKRIEK